MPSIRTHNLKLTKRLLEITALRRKRNGRRLPSARIRRSSAQVLRNLALLEVPDLHRVRLDLQRNHLIVVVERLVERSLLGAEAAALRTSGLLCIVVAVIVSQGVADVEVHGALFGCVESVGVGG